jgi:two-component sensor histidine kinase
MAPIEPSEPVVEVPPRKGGAGSNQRALRLRIRQQQNLAELGVRALKGAPLAELLDDAARLSADGLEAEFCKVLEYIPSENRLLMRAGVGWDKGLVGTASVGADLASPSGYALRTGKPVISNHLQSEDRFRTPELLADHGVRRAMNVVMQGDGPPFGVLEVDSRSEGEFGEDDISFLQGAANILGMAIERQRQEQALKAALERQELLVKEINHRVKNSLQIVVSMLNLHAGDGSEVAQRLNEASTRVMAIARAHDRLYRSPYIQKIELAGYLSEICGDLQELTPNCDIRFEGSGPIFLTTDRAISLAVVVTELIINAAKHAYPDRPCGEVWVRIERGGQDMARVSVRDEGVGVPADFETRRHSGLGVRLARALAQQTDATFLVERLPRGTLFVLEIPSTS